MRRPGVTVVTTVLPPLGIVIARLSPEPNTIGAGNGA